MKIAAGHRKKGKMHPLLLGGNKAVRYWLPHLALSSIDAHHCCHHTQAD